eukprot:TRINITY_DN9119_c0_g1_i1.p1 TRINITY_DN9119_c0_g1~~TRINITY_DN9119_c0_g1_i1.p1  ORF type:complete len:261 (+),score=57.88 TRINITY_DN9119_c0_g1_i1:35-817(+)
MELSYLRRIGLPILEEGTAEIVQTAGHLIPRAAAAAPEGSLDGRLTRISKALSGLLRHTGARKGLTMKADGFVPVHEILECKDLRKLHATLQDVQTAVFSNDKQRFDLRQQPEGCLEIRAKQGHSIKAVEDDALLGAPLTLENLPATCLHGTYLSAWDRIQESGGLKTMGRNHLHFATGLLGKEGVISGMRFDCEVAIFLDLERCIKAGIMFYQSENGVILTPGIDGMLSQKFFQKAVKLKRGSAGSLSLDEVLWHQQGP